MCCILKRSLGNVAYNVNLDTFLLCQVLGLSKNSPNEVLANMKKDEDSG